MRTSSLVSLFVTFCAAAFGQVDANSITVSAAHGATLQPDQAVFAVTVQSGLGTGLDDVLAALQGSGITASNLAGVASTNQYINPNASNPSMLQWTFTLSTALTNTKATVASLTTLQQNIAKQNNGLTLSFSIVGTQVSQQLAQSQTCSLTSLIAEATAQAQSLAAAGGLTLGAIVAISGATSNVVANTQAYVGLGAIVSSSPLTLAPPCAITLRFNATRFQ